MVDFPFTKEFQKEAEKYNLKYKCSDCIHFISETSICEFEHDTNNRYYFYIMDLGEKNSPRFTFCKHFEYN